MDFIQYKLNNSKCINNIKKETITYFYIIIGFKKGINKVFSDFKKTKTIVHRLQALK